MSGTLKSKKLVRYKDTDILFQGTHEKHFLEVLEKQNGLQYIIENIQRGPVCGYKDIKGKERNYWPDFLDVRTNTIYEVKSGFWWDAIGKDQDRKNNNKKKLLSAEQSGYNTILVLSKKFIEDWKSL